jgi:hypothetical protein
MSHHPEAAVEMDTKVDDQHRDIVYQDQRVEKAVGVFIEGAVRSKWESLPRLQIRRLFWKLALCCLAVAFSAFLDGYPVTLADNLIANTGFIKQFATEVDSTGAPIITASTFAIWGPIGSLCQWA